MSVLKRTPILEEILGKLTTEQLQSLLTEMNTTAPNMPWYSLVGNASILPSEETITTISLELAKGRQNKTGFYINIPTENLCVLIAYHRFQDLQVIELSPETSSFVENKEYCDIEELRRIIGIKLGEGSGSGSDVEVNAEIPEGTETETATNIRVGDDYFEIPQAGGFPAASGEDKVIVSNLEGQGEWKDAVPLADDLRTTAGTETQTVYSMGPTGGMQDVNSKIDGRLYDVGGYTIVWNQLLDDDEHSSVTLKSGHTYAHFTSAGGEIVEGDDETVIEYVNEFSRLYDLTTMFYGYPPFNIGADYDETEYPENGTLPAQEVTSIQSMQRFFAHKDLYHEPYNAGTFESASCNKLTEAGRNLWNKDDVDMVANGLLLLPGYRYEIYYENPNDDSVSIPEYVSLKVRGTNTWGGYAIQRAQIATGRYLSYIVVNEPSYIKSYTGGTLVYVGFVHSGNNCLFGYDNDAITYVEIPAYEKHEYPISGISNLRGLDPFDLNYADTLDYTRVAQFDLDTVQNDLVWDEDYGAWSIQASLIPNFDWDYIYYLVGTKMTYAIDDYDEETGIAHIICEYEELDDTTKPSGVVLYNIEPVPTGNPAFTPIELKVNDMGLEYFSGMSITPVLSKTLYGLNLKDKLVNLQEPEEIEYNESNKPLSGIKFRNTYYKLIPQGIDNNEYKNNFLIGDYVSANSLSGYNVVISRRYCHLVNSSNSILLGNEFGADDHTVNRCVVIGGSSDTIDGNNNVIVGQNVGISESASLPINYSVAVGTDIQINEKGTAIGWCSTTTGQNGVAIGYLSKSGSTSSVAIGSESYAKGNKSVAIGDKAITPIQNTVGFDSTTSSKTLVLGDASNVFLRNTDRVTASFAQFTDYPSGHFLNEYINNNNLVLGDSRYWISYTDASTHKGFTDNLIKGVHLTIRIDGSSSNAVVGMDLLPYETATSKTFTAYALYKLDGNVYEITAYIDSDGAVVFDRNITNVKYVIR